MDAESLGESRVTRDPPSQPTTIDDVLRQADTGQESSAGGSQQATPADAFEQTIVGTGQESAGESYSPCPPPILEPPLVATGPRLLPEEEPCGQSGIPSDIYNSLRKALLRQNIFSDDNSLKAVFVTNRIKLWQSGLPNATSPEDRVKKTIAYLCERFNNNGDNALVLFLTDLAEQTPDEDAAKNTLNAIIAELKKDQAKKAASAYQRICGDITEVSFEIDKDTIAEDSIGKLLDKLTSEFDSELETLCKKSRNLLVKMSSNAAGVLWGQYAAGELSQDLHIVELLHNKNIR
ncbi:MAG: hypothetical protein JXR84_13330 [Anaerolineae bacterium]|nr:hypothetical protein [Anaerolineae bacterium]